MAKSSATEETVDPWRLLGSQSRQTVCSVRQPVPKDEVQSSREDMAPHTSHVHVYTPKHDHKTHAHSHGTSQEAEKVGLPQIQGQPGLHSKSEAKLAKWLDTN